MKIISAEQAAGLIEDDWCVIPGGFGSCGHPDSLTEAIRARFLKTKQPRRLQLLFGPGPGNKRGKGVDALALDGLVSKAIGGFWGLSPALAAMARRGLIEAHNWPQGVISKLYSAIAAGSPGVVSKVGLGTFVDPDIDGGVIDAAGSTPLVERIAIKDKDYLFYPAQNVDCALIRGTSTDPEGNISFSEETSYMDALAQALAVKHCGGIVVVQVKRLVSRTSMLPSQVRIPGFLVDYVVMADDEEHPQTYGKQSDPSFTSRTATPQPAPGHAATLSKLIIADRAALELVKHRGANVNLGIGIPALIGERAAKLGLSTGHYTLTVESGAIGGIPAQGLSFGAAMNPAAFIEQSAIFDFYDGGGLDVAFLGFGQIDSFGNVNVSRLGENVPGAGGFINISQSAKKVVFCGTLTAKDLKVAMVNGELVIETEGRSRKLVDKVQQITFNAGIASRECKEIVYITERAVFTLHDHQLQLVEIAPGVTVDALRSAVGCDFTISHSLGIMPNFQICQYASCVRVAGQSDGGLQRENAMLEVL